MDNHEHILKWTPFSGRSYLVDSVAFAQLPKIVREYVYQQMHDVLTAVPAAPVTTDPHTL